MLSRQPRFNSTQVQKCFNLFKLGIEPKGEQEQQQEEQLKYSFGLWPMAADKKKNDFILSYFNDQSSPVRIEAFDEADLNLEAIRTNF